MDTEKLDAILEGYAASMEVVGNGRVAPCRWMHVSTLVSMEPRLAVYNNSVSNVASGLATRVLLRKGKPHEEPTINIKRRLAWATSALRKHVPPPAKASREEFVESCNGRRKTVYARALESLEIRKLTRKDAYVSPFIKNEPYELDEHGNPVKDPRIISPRTARYALELGTYIRPLEAVLLKGLGKLVASFAGARASSVTVFKGLNLSERGAILRQKWERFRNPRFVGLDCHRFDSSVSKSVLLWEHCVYRQFFPGDGYLAWLLRQQLLNEGTAYAQDGKVKFRVQGRRMSGDPNTSLGNSLIMTVILLDYMKHLGVDFELVDDGDDAGVMVDASNLHKLDNLENHYKLFGFLLTREAPVRVFERIEFCASQPVWTANGYRMVRIPTRALTRDVICYHRFQGEKEWNAWRGAVAAGGLAGAGDLPILSAFYKHFDSGARGTNVEVGWGLSRLTEGVRAGQSVLTKTRVSFFEAFGIPPSQQVALEQLIEAAPKPEFGRKEACISLPHLFTPLHAH